MPEGISLIFAGNYPDNPGSIFGHTFLKVKTSAKSRLQSQGKKRLDILDYAINYLANVTDDVGVLYAFKGLLGFYRGLYTLEPYYLKVSEYSEGEGRDIWEYELNVTSEESHFILAQYWELRYQAKFSYYFLDDNCSFHILKMLDVTKPEWKLIENNPSYVIPVETVKNLSSKIGAIKNVNFRPSIRKKAETAYNKLSFGQKSMTLELMRGEQDPKEVSDVDVINTVVLNFFSKRSLNDGKLSVKDQALMEQLLNRLAKLDTSHLSGSTFEGKSPTESHNVKQIGLGFGHQGSNYLQFQFRPGLHDITDFQRGYLDSSELVILDTQVRWQNQKLTIREINLASLSLMRPTTFREKSFSWKTQWNYFNQSQIFCNFCRSIYGEASIGLAQNFFTNQMLYFLFGGFVQPQNLGTNEMNGGGFAEFGSIARFGEKIRFITSIKFYQNMLNVNKVSRLDLFSAGLHWNPVKDIDLNLTSKSGIVVHGSQHYRADATLSVDYHY